MNTETTFDKALDDYRFAQEEMMRPEEDVVLLSACYSVKRAIRGFLEGYLTSVSVKTSPTDELESLIQKCVLQNPDFLRFNIDVLQCKCDKGLCAGQSYCMTMEQVRECLKLMTDLCEFVLTFRKR